MQLNDYQRESRSTARYPDAGRNLIYPTLGLTGEAGEVADKVKKLIRDRGGVIDDQFTADIALELGDVLWYIAQLATELGLDLDAVAEGNLRKLEVGLSVEPSKGGRSPLIKPRVSRRRRSHRQRKWRQTQAAAASGSER